MKHVLGISFKNKVMKLFTESSMSEWSYIEPKVSMNHKEFLQCLLLIKNSTYIEWNASQEKTARMKILDIFHKFLPGNTETNA